MTDRQTDRPTHQGSLGSNKLYTYADNNKIEAGPDAGEVSPEPEGDPFEQHLDGEQDGEDQVHDLKDELELLVVLKRYF